MSQVTHQRYNLFKINGIDKQFLFEKENTRILNWIDEINYKIWSEVPSVVILDFVWTSHIMCIRHWVLVALFIKRTVSTVRSRKDKVHWYQLMIPYTGKGMSRELNKYIKDRNQTDKRFVGVSLMCGRVCSLPI